VDSLIYLNYDQMLYGQEFTVKNPTTYDIQINEIDHQSMTMFYWYIEPWDITLPYLLSGGDSLVFNVKIGIPVLAPTVWMVYDTLDIVSQYDLHQVIIGVDYNLISGTENDIQDDLSLKISPNPFHHQVRIDLGLPGEKSLKADILDFSGQHVKSFPEFSTPRGECTLYWDGTDDAGVPVASGVYFICIASEGNISNAKLILIR